MRVVDLQQAVVHEQVVRAGDVQPEREDEHGEREPVGREDAQHAAPPEQPDAASARRPVKFAAT